MAIDAGAIYSSIRIRLDQLQKDINSVNAKFDTFNTRMTTRANKFQGVWQAAFTAIGFAGVQAFQALLRAGREAIGIFTGFQQSMRNTQSVTNAVGEELRLMTDAAKTAGETTRFTARQAADALYFLGSAGFSARQSVDALNGVLQLAGATQSDLAETSSSVAAIISQYNLQASDAAKISNIFAAAIANSQATMEKLTTAFRQVGPVAAGLGLSLEQTTGALQLLFNAGFRGQQAGRALKSALADLSSPTANITKIFGKLGIELNKVNPETNNFADIIETLQKSGISTAQIIDAFGKVAGPQLAVLIKQGGDAIRKYTEDVTGTNAATEAYAIQNDSLAGSLDFLRSKLESVAIEIIGKMEPGMRDLINTFIEFLDASRPFGELLGNILNLILQISGIPLKVLTAGLNILKNSFQTIDPPLIRATESLKKATGTIEEAGKIEQTANKLNKLTDEYENLTNKSELTEKEQTRLKNVIAEIDKIAPSAAVQIDKYGNAIIISAEKSREAARQLLETRKAIILEAKARLEREKPLLEAIIRNDKAEAERISNERDRLVEESNFANQRIAIIQRFTLQWQTAIASGEERVNAFLRINKEMQEELQYIGIELNTVGGIAAIVGAGFGDLSREQEKAENTLKKLGDTIEKTDIEIQVEDAEKKLKELDELIKDLENVLLGINELDKIDPITDESINKIDEAGKLLEDFWANYKKGLRDAAIEANIFGDIQDELKARLDFLKKSIIELVQLGIDPNTISIKKLKMEYDLTLAILNSYIESEKEALELQKKREQDQEELTSIIKDYTEKLEELNIKEENRIELERRRAIETVQALDVEKSAIEEAITAINQYYDALKNKEGAKLEVDEIIQEASNLASALISLSNAVTETRLNNLDRELQETLKNRGLLEETERERIERELEDATRAGNTELAQEKENQLQKIIITEEFEKKKADIQYKAAFSEWLLKVASVAASAAEAIMKATASLNPFLITTAISTSGVQAAAVVAARPQPPAFQTGGIYLNPTAGTEGASAILHDKEMILNMDQMKNLFNMINQGNISTGQVTKITVIYQVDGVEIARNTANVMNDGIVTLKPDRALRQ